jgi:probable HAF family extracellular repeat protein
VLGGLDSTGWAVNARGAVVGHADTYPDSGSRGFHAYLWTKQGSIVDLGTLPGDRSSTSKGVNASGTVVGISLSADGISRAFAFDGRMRDLGSLGGGSAEATAINDVGQIVGVSSTRGGKSHAFLWSPSAGGRGRGTMVDLGALPGRPHTDATAISPNGLVVGGALDADYYGRAFLWTPNHPNGTTGRMRLLPFLPGGTYSGATGVNDRGQVVGNADSTDGERGFLYWKGHLTILQPLPGGTHSYAWGISRDGVVVGYADDGTGDRAVAWVGGRVIDLNDRLDQSVRDAGVVLRGAFAINTRGQIVGDARVSVGHAHGYLLTGALHGRAALTLSGG